MAKEDRLKSSDVNFNLPRINQQAVIDGIVDDEIWGNALKIDVNIETNPGENIPALVTTTAYLYEDGENLYVAFIANDTNPSEIRAHYHVHDRIFDDDLVGFKVDTFNDDLHAYQFFVNALGVKHDSIEDGITNTDDMSWNSVWDAAGRITENGYEVEISVPLRILRFDDSKSIQEWGFDLLRFYPRKVRHRISQHKLDRNNSCSLCQNPTLTGLSDVKTGENIEIVPYMTASQNKQRVNPLTDPWVSSDVNSDFGADIRWGISTNTTLNATFNPDFSQVESDVAQLDINNAFSLFFPEKRPFFLEGTDYYKTPLNLVHTRNISTPDYGLKLTNSSNRNNYAAFFTNDTVTNYVLPGTTGSNIASYQTDSNNGVMRYRRDFDNTTSIGAIVTLREADDYHNYVYGIDGVYRITETDIIKAQLLGSDTTDPQSIVDQFTLDALDKSGTAATLEYTHEARDWRWWADYSRFGKSFRADMGFQPNVNFEQYVVGLEGLWYPEEGASWWNKLSLGTEGIIKKDLDGQLLDKNVKLQLGYEGSLHSIVTAGIGTGEQYWNGTIYPTKLWFVDARFTPFAGFTPALVIESLEAIDFVNSQEGESLLATASLTYNLGQHIQTELQFTNIKMDVLGGELFDSSIMDARLTYQFSTRSFLRLIIQKSETKKNLDLYSNEVDENFEDLGTQLLYSYKINPQTVFFLGYSDAAYQDDSFNQLERVNKTFFMKMSYSWLY